jgi:hypothetical protein
MPWDEAGFTDYNPQGTESFNAMSKIIHGGGGLVGAAGVNTYFPIDGGNAGSAVINLYAIEMPVAGTLSKLTFECDVAPGLGQSITAKIYKNGVASILSVLITGAVDTFGVDGANSLNYTATDKIVLMILNSAGSAVTRWNVGTLNIIP